MPVSNDDNNSEEPSEDAKEPEVPGIRVGVFDKLKNMFVSEENEPEAGEWYCVKMRTLVHTVNDQSEKELVPLQPGERAYVTEITGRKAHVIKPVKGWCNAKTKKGHLILERIAENTNASENRLNVQRNEATETSILSRFTSHLQSLSRTVGTSADSTKLSADPKESLLGSYCVVGDNGVMVRETIALDSNLLGTLHCGTFVNVVQVKGRRARIDRPMEGWVSIRNSDGSYHFLQKREPPLLEKEQLLLQVEALKNTNSNLEVALKMRESKILTLENELNQYVHDLKRREDEISGMKSELQSREDQIELDQAKLKKALKSGENFERLLQQRDLDVRQASAELDTLEKENDSLKQRVSDMAEERSQGEIAHRKLREEVTAMQEKLETQANIIAAYHYRLVTLIRKQKDEERSGVISEAMPGVDLQEKPSLQDSLKTDQTSI